LNPQQMPDAKATGDFLLQGGAFALLCVLLLLACVAAWLAGRALFSLLREFLSTTRDQIETQTKLLGEIHGEQRSARERAEAAADQLSPWGTPEWLLKRLDTLDRRADEIRDQVSNLRISLAKT
jgi:hypothetical protein